MEKLESIGISDLRRAREKGHGLLWVVFGFSVFVNLLMLTGPIFMLQVYDRVLGSRSEETLLALFGLVVALYALLGVLDYARGRVLARIGAQFQARLDGRVFHGVIKASLCPPSRVASASGLRDLENLQKACAAPAMLAFFDLPWTPFFVAVIFLFHPVLGWLALAGGGFLIIVAVLNTLTTSGKSAVAQVTADKAGLLADQAQQACELICAQGMRRDVAARWGSLRLTALQAAVQVSDRTGLCVALSKAFRLLLQSAIVAVGAWLVLQGELTAGAMIAGSILLGRALTPVEQAIGQWPLVQRSIAGWKRLDHLLSETTVPDRALSLPRPVARAEVKGLTVFASGARAPTLSGITFDLHPGQALGVIGKSGSGKSTLARALMNLTQPVAGQVRLGGAALDQYDPDLLGRYIGYLPQQVTLFSGTVAENIARLSQEFDDAKVIDAARQANAHEMILTLPNGYQTVIHGPGTQLSGGQAQRIALARALYHDPVLLVLDEPNSALDSDGVDALNRTVSRIKRAGCSVILMTHRPAAISACDTLIVLDQGRMTANGPRDEVMRAMLHNASDLCGGLIDRKVS